MKIYPTGCNKLYNSFCRMSQDGKGKWNDIQVVNNKSDADYFIILNRTNENVDYNKSILIHGEPEISRKKFGGIWYEPKDTFFFAHTTPTHRNFAEWHIMKDYTYLSNNSPEKTKILSSVTSRFNNLEGHKLRMELLKSVPNMDRFGKGINPIENKEDGLFPYKYTIAIENSMEENYFTEKLLDGILSECLTFYWGCPNVTKWINKDSFVWIDARNKQQALKTIKESIDNNLWEERLHAIRKEKQNILNNIQMLATIERIFKNKGVL